MLFVREGEGVDVRAARSVAWIVLPHVVLKALRAYLTAVSTSSGVACEKSRSFAPVEGSTVGNVLLSDDVVHSLLLRRGRERDGSERSLEGAGVTYMKRPVGTEVSRPEGSVTVWCTLLDMIVVVMDLIAEKVLRRRVGVGVGMREDAAAPMSRVRGSISLAGLYMMPDVWSSRSAHAYRAEDLPNTRAHLAG